MNEEPYFWSATRERSSQIWDREKNGGRHTVIDGPEHPGDGGRTGDIAISIAEGVTGARALEEEE